MQPSLEGKTIIFLGSSVTFGACSGGYSFVDHLSQHAGLHAVKEAVSGTTLVDNGETSYIARLKRLPRQLKPDAFLCQLSTNDATQGKPLGAVSPSRAMEDFDTQTVTGALETIIAYVRSVYHCPVLFFTGTRYDSPAYARMVARLHALAKKWPIAILDLWNDAAMNAVSAEDYQRFMHDPIHPTLTGYTDWWSPKFSAFLSEQLGS